MHLETKGHVLAVNIIDLRTDSLVGLVNSTELCRGLLVRVIGKPLDMSLPELSESSSKTKTCVLGEPLSDHLERLGIKKLIVPNISASNAKFGEANMVTFDSERRTERGVRIFRNSISIDAFPVPPGCAEMMRSGDCPTLVITHGGKGSVVVAHCSRDSLFCHQEILTGKKDREHSSVIDAIMEHLKGLPPRDIRAYVTCGIDGKNFEHNPQDETHGKDKYNRKLIDFIDGKYGRRCFCRLPSSGLIKLNEVVKAQLGLYGINNVSCDQLDTFSDERLHSNRCGDKGRNGVLVVNNMRSK